MLLLLLLSWRVLIDAWPGPTPLCLALLCPVRDETTWRTFNVHLTQDHACVLWFASLLVPQPPLGNAKAYYNTFSAMDNQLEGPLPPFLTDDTPEQVGAVPASLLLMCNAAATH